MLDNISITRAFRNPCSARLREAVPSPQSSECPALIAQGSQLANLIIGKVAANPSPVILQWCHGFEVLWIYARSISTKMVYNKPVGDRPFVLDVVCSVGRHFRRSVHLLASRGQKRVPLLRQAEVPSPASTLVHGVFFSLVHPCRIMVPNDVVARLSSYISMAGHTLRCDGCLLTAPTFTVSIASLHELGHYHG